MFAPCRRAEVLSWGFATPGVAPGGALDSTEELWHPSPKGDKFGVMGVCRGAGRKKIPLRKERDFVVPFQDYGFDRS